MVRILVLIVILIGGIFTAVQQFQVHRLRGDVGEALQAYARYDLGRLEHLLVKLPKVRGENGIGPLLGMVSNKEMPRIERQVAQMALWKYREAAADRKISHYEAVVRATGIDLNVSTQDSPAEELAEYLGRDDPAYRMAACRGYAALGERAPGGTSERLLEVFLEDAFFPVRAEAAKALGAVGDGKAVKPLAKEAKELTDFGLVCVEALAKIPGGEARRALEALLEVRPAAVARAFEKRGEPEAIEALAGQLDKGAFPVRAATARALAVLGDARGLSALRSWLTQGPVEERLTALSASRGIEDAKLLELQVVCGSELDPLVRARAAWALGGSSKDLAAAALRALLTDSELAVQAAAMRAIAARQDAAFQEILVEKLHSNVPELMLPAIDGVVALGLREEIDTLKRLLKDPESTDEVAKAAWMALKTMTGIAPGLDARRRSLFEVAKPIELPN